MPSVLGVAIWLWRRGAQRLAVWAVVTMAVGGVLGVLLKLLVDRARPAFPEPVAHASGYSFPSGHALNSMLGVGVLLLVFLPVLRGTGRIVAYAGSVPPSCCSPASTGSRSACTTSATCWPAGSSRSPCLAGTATAFEVWRREQGRRPSDGRPKASTRRPPTR